MIYFSDLHMTPESEDTCFAVLDAVLALQRQTGDVVGFLGDFWHTRYQLPVYLLNRVRESLQRFHKLHVLPGNHDQYDVNGRHALEVFDALPNVVVHSEPGWEPSTGCWLPYRKDPAALVEWIAAHPRPDGYPDVAHLHHGVVGAAMNTGMTAGERDGLRLQDLPFSRVYCGHWHRHQAVGHVVFVGSQWQTRADEAGQVKGVVTAGPFSVNLTHYTGVRWEFLPLAIGPAHHKLVAFSRDELAQLRPGDRVRVPAETSEKMVATLRAAGVDVTRMAPPPAEIAARLRSAPGAGLRSQAEQYVAQQQIPEGVTADELMRVFDEVAS